MDIPPRYFPPPERADRDGLLAVGGRLDPEWLVEAYSRGIFPWPLADGTLAWWSPDPRAVFEWDAFHVSRRLARTVRSGRFEVTIDRDFAGVIRACATSGDRRGATWITSGIERAYGALHELGIAHSLEVWREGELAGGIYGVALGGMFAGESMFSRHRDASKVALVHLIAHLRTRGYVLFDIQQYTAHAASLGASVLPRAEFLTRLASALRLPVTFGEPSEGVSPGGGAYRPRASGRDSRGPE